MNHLLVKLTSVPRHAYAVAALLAAGLLLRVSPIGHQGLWYDEVFSASYTNLSLFETIVACMRFDVHPPLYYLQLNLWSILGHGDAWLMMNSVFWGMCSLMLVYVIARRLAGVRAGLIALAACAVLGSEVFFANELRPYTFLGTLMLASWLAAERLHGDYRLRAAVPLILLLIATGGAHSFGPIAVSGALLYAFPKGSRRQVLSRLPTWLGTCALAGVASLPWMVNAAMRHVGHMTPVKPAVIIYTASGWVLGYGWQAPGFALQVAVCVLIALLLAVGLWRTPALRRMILCYMLWPIVFTAVASFLWKPIWLFRPFSYCAPLLAVVFGVVAAGLLQQAGRLAWRPRTVRRTADALLLAGLAALAGCSYKEALVEWKTPFRQVADFLKQHVQPGDVIYVPEQVEFWGTARYLVGPTWGSLLKVEDPVNQDRSAYWPRIYQRLGTEKLQWLHLVPQTRRLDGFTVPIYVGWSPLAEAHQAASVWVLDTPTSAGGPPLSLRDVLACNYKVIGTAEFLDDLRLFHVACSQTGTEPRTGG